MQRFVCLDTYLDTFGSPGDRKRWFELGSFGSVLRVIGDDSGAGNAISRFRNLTFRPFEGFLVV